VEVVPVIVSFQQAVGSIVDTEERYLLRFYISLVKIGDDANPILVGGMVRTRM
jgi:hypothetical protein